MPSLVISGVNENNFLNIYNNNVANFQFDNTDNLALANYLQITVAASGFPSAVFRVTQFTTDISDQEFTFNLKQAFKSLSGGFLDSKEPYEKITKDSTLLRTYTVDYFFVTTEPEDNYTEQVVYNAFKSVEQIGETIEKPITDPYLLTNNNITVFKGYPFDFSIYSNSSIGLTNLNTGVFVFDGGVSTGVNRVFLSRGRLLLDELDQETEFVNRVLGDGGTLVDNSCVIYDLEPILRTGYNDLQINLGAFTPKQLKVKLIDPCSGVYLKWFNEKGSWSYWLFNSIYKDRINSKVIDVYNTDFSSVEETYHASLITGKEAKNTIDLQYKGLDDYEFEQVKDILTSPRVELFIGNINDNYALTVANGGADYSKAWMSVRVLDGSLTKNTKIGLHNIAISIDKNKYTQS